MIYGIKFQINNTHKSLLYDILKGCINENHYWRTSNEDVHLTENIVADLNNTFLFKEFIFRGNDFEQLIRDNIYYAIFVDAYEYENESDAINAANWDAQNIMKTYKEFIASKCLLALSVVDNIFVTIVAKNKSTILKIQKNVKIAGFSDIEIITENSDLEKLCLGL